MHFKNIFQISNRILKIRNGISYKFASSTNSFNILTVTEGDEGMTLVNYMKKRLHFKWKSIHELIRKKKIKVFDESSNEISFNLNGRLEKDYQLQIHQNSDIPLVFQTNEKPLETVYSIAFNNLCLSLQKDITVFENSKIKVINKYPGICSQGGNEELINLHAILPKKPDSNLMSEFIVHRLDRSTSGLMLVAKSRSVASIISELLKEREGIQKKYIGIMQGIPDFIKEREGIKARITCPLIFNKNKMKTFVTAISSEGKESVTDVEIIGIIERNEENFKGFITSDTSSLPDLENPDSYFYTIAIFNLIGGRKHQIRAHCAQILNCPLILDTKYGFQKEKKSIKFNSLIDSMNEENISSTSIKVSNENNELFNFMNSQKYSETDKSGFLKNIIKEESFSFLHSLCITGDDKLSNLFFHNNQQETSCNKIEITQSLPIYFEALLRKAYSEKYDNLIENIFNKLK